jgi:hypothetical protein
MLTLLSVTALIAIKNNLESLGLSSIIFSVWIPLLVGGFSDPIFLMLYVLMIDLAALWMLIKRGWGVSFHIAWLATFFYAFNLVRMQSYLISNVFLWTFYLTFFLPIAFPIYRKKLPNLPLKGSFILVTLMMGFAFWIHDLTLFPWNTLSYFTGSLSFALLGYLICQNWDEIESQNPSMKYVLGSIAGFSALAWLFIGTYKVNHYFFSYKTCFEVQTLLVLLETVGALFIGYFVLKSPLFCAYVSLFLLIPLGFIVNHPASFLYAPLFSLKFAILCAAIFSFFMGGVINRKALIEDSLFQKVIVNWLSITTGILVMMLIWNLCQEIISSDNVARGVSLVSYVIIGEGMIYFGDLKGLKNVRMGGVAMISFVIFQLLVEEVWKMPIPIRMVTFVVIGLLLIATAFFGKKNYKGVRENK